MQQIQGIASVSELNLVGVKSFNTSIRQTRCIVCFFFNLSLALYKNAYCDLVILAVCICHSCYLSFVQELGYLKKDSCYWSIMAFLGIEFLK